MIGPVAESRVRLERQPVSGAHKEILTGPARQTRADLRHKRKGEFLGDGRIFFMSFEVTDGEDDTAGARGRKDKIVTLGMGGRGGIDAQGVHIATQGGDQGVHA